jgi:uncharacterized small protein (DUF1192 family)
MMNDLEPRPKTPPLSALDLSPLSIADLEQRVLDLEAEIVRVRAAMTAKQAQKAAADSVFGKKS